MSAGETRQVGQPHEEEEEEQGSWVRPAVAGLVLQPPGPQGPGGPGRLGSGRPVASRRVFPAGESRFHSTGVPQLLPLRAGPQLSLQKLR